MSLSSFSRPALFSYQTVHGLISANSGHGFAAVLMKYVDERKGSPPVIAGIKDDSLLFDARTLQEKDFGDILLRMNSIIE